MLVSGANERQLLQRRGERLERTEKTSEEFGGSFTIDEGEGAQVVEEARVDEREEKVEGPEMVVGFV